VNDSGLRVMRM